jgi:hypothetical protein
MRVAIGLPSKTDDWHFILAKQMGCEEVEAITRTVSSQARRTRCSGNEDGCAGRCQLVGSFAQLGRHDQDARILGQLLQRGERGLDLEVGANKLAIQSSPRLQPFAGQKAPDGKRTPPE